MKRSVGGSQRYWSEGGMMIQQDVHDDVADAIMKVRKSSELA